uniref:Transcriptional regulator n=1 Tax=Steinernema glaseri TaxID=37863 RepID=A0A1I7Y8F2_9BILA
MIPWLPLLRISPLETRFPANPHRKQILA